MHRKRVRGNLLLMAVFMSVFLFFLSVALVATNRQDLMLAIFVDNHLRAQTAARAGANFALETMGSDPQWETDLTNKTGTMTSGATWKVDVSPYLGTDATPKLVKIHSHGTSGFLAEDYSIIAEEYRIADSIAKSGSKPHVFMLCNTVGDAAGAPPTQLMMLTPAFKWQFLEYLSPSNVTASTLSGGGGPMFICRNGGPPPPLVSDYSVTSNSYVAGQPVYKLTPVQSVKTGFQSGQILEYLELQGSNLVWTTAPDPNIALSTPKWVLPTIDGVKTTAVPPPVIKTETLKLGVTTVTVDVSAHLGGVIDWYAINGTKTAAEGSKVYVYAIHSIYVGEQTHNIIDGSGLAYTQSGTYKAPQSVSAPCVLCYNTDSKTWSKIMDPFDNNGYEGSYKAYTDPTPDTSTMAVSNGNVFALTLSTTTPYKTMLQAVSRRWQTYSNDALTNPVLIGYNNTPHPLVQAGTTLQASAGQGTLLQGILSPTNSFATDIPSQTANLYNNATNQYEPWPAQHERTLTINLTRTPGCYTVAGSDLWCMAQIVASDTVPATAQTDPSIPSVVESEPVSNYAFVHFDGTSWQVLPNGMHGTLYGTSNDPNGVDIYDVTGAKYVAQYTTTVMALCGYASSIPLQRRYQPLQFIR